MKIPRLPFAEEAESYEVSHFYFTLMAIILFILVIMRLWYLQVVRGGDFRTQSENNRTRIQDIISPRGLIKDRQGLLLVDNFPSYDLAIIREDVRKENFMPNDQRIFKEDREKKPSDLLLERLAYYLRHPYPELKKRYDENKKLPAFKPGVIYSDMTREQLVAVESHRFKLPGVQIQVKPRRRYLQPDLSSHIIGYLSEITRNQLDQEKYADNRIGDIVGQSGIELSMENYLQGQRGRRVVEVNAAGRLVKVVNRVDPRPGNNLTLTIDTNLQEIAQEALKDQVGAIVALDPETGEVLVMVSSPTFNQSDFVNGISPDKWRELLDNPLHPLENRAISGQYPPGSTYKIVTATAALESKVITPDTKFVCKGELEFYDRVFWCWKKTGHGAISLNRAIKESCDVYFYEVGHLLGIDRLSEYAQAFGLGRPTGVGLAGEKSGLVASTTWKKKRFGTPWLQGETLSVAIGQGFNMATPIQMAQVTAVIANGGRIIRPHLVKEITDPDGRLIKSYEPEVIRSLELKPETLKRIRDGMTAAVNEPGGTGGRARMKDMLVAGKTGTSQVVAMKRDKDQDFKKKDLPYKYQDHAWFVAFAPADRPKIAISVLVEHAGHGGEVAAPLAKRVLYAFFHPESPLLPEDATPSGHDVGD